MFRSNKASTSAIAIAFWIVLIPAPADAAPVASDEIIVLTDTATGDALLAEFEERLAETPGPDPSVKDYQVLTNVPGDDPEALWILPSLDELPVIHETIVDGQFEISIELPSEPAAAINLARGSSKNGQFSRAGSLSWQAASCFARYTTSYGWFDRCTQWGVVVNDGDGARDHWVFKYYGTCKSNSYNYVQTCGLSSVRSSTSSTLYWEDWAPKADSSGGCRSVSVSVSVFGISAGGSYQGCDTVDITKYAEAGRFSNVFRTPSAYMTERSVQYQISLGVPQGGTPRLTTNASMTGYLKTG